MVRMVSWYERSNHNHVGSHCGPVIVNGPLIMTGAEASFSFPYNRNSKCGPVAVWWDGAKVTKWAGRALIVWRQVSR